MTQYLDWFFILLQYKSYLLFILPLVYLTLKWKLLLLYITIVLFAIIGTQVMHNKVCFDSNSELIFAIVTSYYAIVKLKCAEITSDMPPLWLFSNSTKWYDRLLLLHLQYWFYRMYVTVCYSLPFSVKSLLNDLVWNSLTIFPPQSWWRLFAIKLYVLYFLFIYYSPIQP